VPLGWVLTVSAGNDWHPSWVADTAGDCAQDDALHGGGADGLVCAVQPEQTRNVVERTIGNRRRSRARSLVKGRRHAST
jgi:hypothetical protein